VVTLAPFADGSGFEAGNSACLRTHAKRRSHVSCDGNASTVYGALCDGRQ
jgi:hypothetical protein